MMRRKLVLLGIVLCVTIGVVAFYMKGRHDGSPDKKIQLTREAQATGGTVKDPNSNCKL